jgi:hypothetical protein
MEQNIDFLFRDVLPGYIKDRTQKRAAYKTEFAFTRTISEKQMN